jgi:hypothetical protein
MKRLPGEDFEEYKIRRRARNRALKHYLKGRMIWISSVLVPKYRERTKRIELVKLPVQGTYRKEKANEEDGNRPRRDLVRHDDAFQKTVNEEAQREGAATVRLSDRDSTRDDPRTTMGYFPNIIQGSRIV